MINYEEKCKGKKRIKGKDKKMERVDCNKKEDDARGENENEEVNVGKRDKK